jgi:hypothetical protein
MTFHDAYLVESYRDENGKPRQQTLAYLGNIRQIDDEFPGIERELFLLRAERILADLPELSATEQREIVQQLQKKVPPLTSDEVVQAFYENLRWYHRWWRDNGGAPSTGEIQRLIQCAKENWKGK